MRVIKFNKFIKESIINDTPESYIETILRGIKIKIDKMFDYQDVDNVDINSNVKKTINRAKSDGKNDDKVSFKDIGVKLESSEISKYSKMFDSLTIKFSDDENWYSLYLTIDIKSAIPKDGKEFSTDDIKKCFIKFKKYSINANEIIGQVSKNINISDISEDFLIKLKIDIDEEFGDEEEFEIETE